MYIFCIQGMTIYKSLLSVCLLMESLLSYWIFGLDSNMLPLLGLDASLGMATVFLSAWWCCGAGMDVCSLLAVAGLVVLVFLTDVSVLSPVYIELCE